MNQTPTFPLHFNDLWKKYGRELSRQVVAGYNRPLGELKMGDRTIQLELATEGKFYHVS